MRRKAVSVGLAALLVLLSAAVLTGCGPTQRNATFEHYETTPTADSPGTALIKLDDGTEVTAESPMTDLLEGEPMLVQQDSAHHWLLLHKR